MIQECLNSKGCPLGVPHAKLVRHLAPESSRSVRLYGAASKAAPPAPPALGNYGSPGMAMGGPGQGPGSMGAPMPLG